MIKRLSYLASSILAMVSLFLAYSSMGLKFISGVPEASQEAIRASAEKNNALVATFFEYIGDFGDTSYGGVASRIIVFLAMICAVAVFISAIIAIIKKSNKVFEVLEVKWISVAGFGLIVLGLLIAFIFPSFPPVSAALTAVGVTGFSASIGVGSILFIIAMLGASVVSFAMKDNK